MGCQFYYRQQADGAHRKHFHFIQPRLEEYFGYYHSGGFLRGDCMAAFPPDPKEKNRIDGVLLFFGYSCYFYSGYRDHV